MMLDPYSQSEEDPSHGLKMEILRMLGSHRVTRDDVVAKLAPQNLKGSRGVAFAIEELEEAELIVSYWEDSDCMVNHELRKKHVPWLDLPERCSQEQLQAFRADMARTKARLDKLDAERAEPGLTVVEIRGQGE